MKKLFKELNLTWPKIIIMGLVMGIYTAIMAMLPIARDTSFSDLTVTFEVWILFGIIIIMNSKSAKDSALKCFVFFLISQPLVYIIQDVINQTNLFNRYYSFWFIWTIACIPMGYIGYYMKKDKWWGLLILTPILALLGYEFSGYLSNTIFSFPRHLLTTLFCIASLIIYPLAIFKDKKIRITGLIISIIIIIAGIIMVVINPPVYSTDILADGDENHFDNTYKVYLKDDKYGKLNIEYLDSIDVWMVHAEFTKAGNTEFTLEAPNGDKKEFNLTIYRNKYSVDEKKI